MFFAIGRLPIINHVRDRTRKDVHVVRQRRREERQGELNARVFEAVNRARGQNLQIRLL